MEKEELLRSLTEAILEYDKEKARNAAVEVIESGMSPVEGIEKGLSKGMEIVGDKFSKLEIYLPELIMATNVFNTAMTVLEPEILAKKGRVRKTGIVVLGTVKGDVHDIGKTIVGTLLKTAGFEVYDLGVDVSSSTFIREAERVNADIIGLSALLTTTMPIQKEVLELLKEQGKRNKYIAMVGGAPVNQKWADEIGADGYAPTGAKAMKLALELVKRGSKQ